MDYYTNGAIMTQAASPCGTTVATLSSNEQILLWKLFEKVKVDLSDERELFNEDAERINNKFSAN